MGIKYSCLDCVRPDTQHIEFDMHPQTQADNPYENFSYDITHIKSARAIQKKYRKLKCYNKVLQNLFILIEEKMKSIEVISIEDLKEKIDQNKFNILNSFEEEIKAKRNNNKGLTRIDFGAMFFEEKNEYYLGEWNLKGEKAGLGTLIMQDKSVYYGYFENDIYNGNGVFINDDGYYHGKWKEGKFHGHGTLKYFNSIAEYKGEWVENLKVGKGEEKYEDGSCYIGNFKKGEKEWDGIYIWHDGSKYIGHFKNSQLEGKGNFTWADGRSYSGFWKENKFNGHGIHKWPNGNYYDGYYKLGKRNGEGVYCWSNDNYYNGLWFNNFQHGEGTLTIKNRNHSGAWRYGKLIRVSEISKYDRNANCPTEKNETFYDSPSPTFDDKNNTKVDMSYL